MGSDIEPDAPHLQPLQSPRHALSRRRARTRIARRDPARRRASRSRKRWTRPSRSRPSRWPRASSISMPIGLVDRLRARGRTKSSACRAGHGGHEPGPRALGHRRARDRSAGDARRGGRDGRRRSSWCSTVFRTRAMWAPSSAPPTAAAPPASIAIEGTADPFGWKALRGAMGSTFRLPVAVRQPAAPSDRRL